MTFEEQERLRAELIKKYQVAAPDSKSLTQLVSVFFNFVDRRKLQAALSSVAYTLPREARPGPQALKSILEDTVASGLLERSAQGGYRCAPLLVEHASREAVRTGFFPELARAVKASRQEYWESESVEGKLRELRIALYLNEGRDRIFNLLSELERYHHQHLRDRHPLVLIFDNPFDAGSVASLPRDLQVNILFRIFMHAAFRLEPASNVEAFARAFLETPQKGDEYACYGFAQYLLLRGKVEEAEKLLLASGTEAGPVAVRAWFAFLRGEDEKAVELYESALKLLRKATGKQRVYFRGLYGAWYPLLLIAGKDPLRIKKALYLIGGTERVSGGYGDVYGDIADILGSLKQVALLTESDDTSSGLTRKVVPGRHFTMMDFFRMAVAYFLFPSSFDVGGAQAFLWQTEANGFTLISMELNELLSRVKGGEEKHAANARAFREATGFRSIFGLMTPEEKWERALAALKNIGAGAAQRGVQNEKRLVWLFQYSSGRECGIQPLEQKLSAKGDWSKGRVVSIDDLYHSMRRKDYLTAQDKQVIDWLYDGRYRWGEDEAALLKALTALTGHPLLFLADSPGVRVELVKGSPEVLVTRGRKDITIALHPSLAEEKNEVVLRETPTRFRIMELTPKHKELVRIIGERLRVPLSAADAVLEAVSSLSSFVQVQSDIGGNTQNLKEVPSEPKPRFVMTPFEEGLRFQVRARPFSSSGPYYRPGHGGETVIAEIDGERVLTARSLKQERSLAEEAINACPVLEDYEEIDGEWYLEDPEDCLELLSALQTQGDRVVVEWPEGVKFKIAAQASFGAFRMSISRESDWFGLTGELTLNEDKVLELRQLIDLLKATPGRFVALGNGEFLALTQEFKKRLGELSRFTETHEKGVRFHPLAIPAIEALTEGADLTTDAHWQERIDRMRRSQALTPVTPSTFIAELRDYQKDGFAWLARLAHWGVGACLADDMGLGKTIQALALLVDRAPRGPALVVAPTSVCMNWIDEAGRFAPTLNIILFGPGDRKETVAALKPFDLLICSYGLMQQEEEMFAAVSWETIVLDEAQAIKNTTTKRSKAAMKLSAEFKMITTGTPVENHLDELWNLFRFINPGLLGSLDAFNEKFINPIERYNDHEARGLLKRLVQPFILRRLKTQVLTELPQKTESSLQVELGEEEAALYEAMRRQSLDRIAGVEGNAGQKSIQILAELTRLRRLCCNPRLVVPNVKTRGAKLELFGEVLEELLENNHKALVFSQFVDHLSILREYLEERKIAYQYLDGSTPQKERKRSVDAFQGGKGDVFLISLKAGGLGLNLTAADYVIHMDPWWNPAVEDQASDRAYRIGQNRPVTIYRLIAKGTIEEKIVDLHKHKRDLADSLLEGSDMSARVSPDELLKLLTTPVGG